MQLRTAWRALPPGLRTRFWLTINATSELAVTANARLRGACQEGPLILSGFAESAFGIARGAQSTRDGLRAAGYEPHLAPIEPVLRCGRLGEARLLPERPGGVWILHANAPEAHAVLSRTRPSDWRGRYRIGVWAWELPVAPASWVRMARAFDEVWVPSRFVAESLAGARTRVVTVPHYVPLPPEPMGPPPTFRVLAAGDAKSSLSRKGVADALAAYLRAFPEPMPSVELVVKVTDAKRAGGEVAALTATRSDVSVRTDTLSEDGMARLQASAAVFLSMHKAEGFGLMIAEHLALGRPAIATGWSGNMDFMKSFGELTVGYTLESVADPSGVYAGHEGQRWAVPSVGDAAAKLRRAYDRWLGGHLVDPRYAAAISAQNAAWRTARLDGVARWTRRKDPGGGPAMAPLA